MRATFDVKGAIQPRVDLHATEPTAWCMTLAVNLDGVVWCRDAQP